ncbi:DUF4127 family protein [Pectinatus sottacetonis]|uniref:DUF4127 family protein n=1 Tax=Pectinatus sottacetonis TaxID=1002795 RepID=UPI001E58029F|nr:DUF4127 family protein [Pectinatus sottacetonis]
MNKLHKRSIFLVLAVITFAAVFHYIYFADTQGKYKIPEQKYSKNVVLIPLDGRPPCRKFVIDAGRLADIKIETPPQQIMDYYTKAGNTKALCDWLKENASFSNGIIVSADQLLYGGLLASRRSFGKNTDQQFLWYTLDTVHQENPSLPVYVFSILPRITPPNSVDSADDIKNLIKYSRLTDKIIFSHNKKDINELDKLQRKISKKYLAQYVDLYNKNLLLNKRLVDLAKQGIITKLVIGQDDGEKYGIPNIERRKLKTYIKQTGTENNVIITHGADEVAMSLLFNMAETIRRENYHPRIFAAYNAPQSEDIILPYMAADVKKIVEEKVSLAGGTIVTSPENADFILYLHIGTKKNLSTRYFDAMRIKKWLSEGKKVALVDLSKNFRADETVFPILLSNDVPVNQLIAYSGWNTASNSIGTAVAQAGLYTMMGKYALNDNDKLRLIYDNLTILYDHFVEDYFYLKGTLYAVNTVLRKAGINNVNDLDMDNSYLWANYMLEKSLQRQIDKFAYCEASREPIKFKTAYGIKNIYLRNIKIKAFFPWPRTFEINTDVKFTMDSGQSRNIMHNSKDD